MLQKVHSTIVVSIIIASLMLSSCSSMIGNLTESLTNSLFAQEDIELIGDGAPAYLLIIEAMVGNNTKNKDMLITAIQAFSAYSTAFVDDPDRGKIFLEKCKKWGLICLNNYPQFAKYEATTDKNQKDEQFTKFINSIKAKDVPYVFWSAYAWALWIMANLDSMEAFIDLPIAKQIIEKVAEIDGDFYYGAPHLFMGTYYAAYPENLGGSMTKAKQEFDYAIRLAGDELLTSKLLYANTYVKAQNDKQTFENILNDIINADVEKYPKTRLLNVITQQQAQKTLEDIDNIFFDFDFNEE